jgi:hypothetical protein
MPQVRLVADIMCGHTKCDVHGNNEVSLLIEYDIWWRNYNFIRVSECYGRLEKVALNKDQLLAVIDEHMMFPHTRRALRKLRSARKVVEDNALKSRWIVERRPIVNSAVTPAPAEPKPETHDVAWASIGHTIRTAPSQTSVYTWAATNVPSNYTVSVIPGSSWYTTPSLITDEAAGSWEDMLTEASPF